MADATLASSDAVPSPEETPAVRDVDPSETREWIESLEYVLESKGPERAAFILAIAAALALTPIVWLHYFALLLVVVAIAQRRLGVLWFVPLGMVVTPGSGHPAPWQTAWTLVVAAVTIGWALWLVRHEGRDLVPLRTAPQPT